MALKIEKDLSRFHKILRGQIKKELKKFMSRGEMFGRKGQDLVSIPLPQIEIPRFVYGEKQKGGVGQGEGDPGQPVEGEEQKGESKAGNLPGEHIMEVEVNLEDLADILGEELELPKIEPKGQEDIVTQHTRYTSVAHTGPESLRHFKRTYKKALRRQIMSGVYDPANPRIIPIREDRVYRSWKTVKKPQSRALIFFLLDVSGCHTAGHFVEMANGTCKDIRDIEIGDWVCSVDLDSREKVHARVTKKFQYTVPKTIRIKTEDHVCLRVTPQHRYFVYDELKDEICEKRADQVQEGDQLILVNQFGQNAESSDTFEQLNEAQAYLIGAILGDGFVNVRMDPSEPRRNSRFVMITDENENRLRYYADCGATAFGIKGLIRDRSDRKRLYFNSATFVNFLALFFPGLMRRSPRRTIDRSLFVQPPKVRAAFLRGFFDAEGTIADHAVEFLNSSLLLVKQVKLMLSYWGIRARITPYWQTKHRIAGKEVKEGEYYRLVINGKDACTFAEHIGFACRTKNQKLRDLVNRENKKTERKRSRYIPAADVKILFSESSSAVWAEGKLYDTRMTLTHSNLLALMNHAKNKEQRMTVERTLRNTLLTCRVHSVERIEEEVDVYDFEVEKYHNYLVDGVLSHNSMGNEQKEIVRIETFWIDTWLRSQYQNLQTRYIIHDAVAREVDRETFFHTRESGGTIISSAYKLCLKLLQEQYNPDEWNIYPFHFSDGDNWSGNDTEECLKLLQEQFFPVCNVFCYGQVESEYGSGQFLKDLQARFSNNEKLIMSKIPNKEAIVTSIKDFLGKGK